MKNRTAQVPFPIVQSEMFLPTTTSVSPYRREWINQYGDRCNLQAPQAPNHFDLVNFLAFLHVIQQERGVEKTPLDELRYKVVMPMSYLYSILNLRQTNQRRDLIDSLKRLARTSLEIQYKQPWKHNDCQELLLTSLTGDLKLFKHRGRTGHILEARPLQALVDDRMLTVDVTRMIALEQPLSRIAAFFVACRPKNGVLMTWEDWMRCLSTGKSLRHFKERFKKALVEMNKYGYGVEDRGSAVLIRRP